MAAPMALRRVLVHVKNSSDVSSIPAKFSQSVMDYLGSSGHTLDVKVKLDDDKLTVYQGGDDDLPPIKIKRPSFCPVHHMSDADIERLPREIQERGVDVGAAVILETADGKILLTRRAHHLRTFPGIWVPPGGHVESGETLSEAGLRELQEETGLSLKAEDCSGGKMNLVALWESVYPPKLSRGPPKRHHVVVYMHAHLVPPFTADYLHSSLKLDPGEVGAGAWLDRSLIEAIVAASEEENNTEVKRENLPALFSALVVSPESQPKEEKIPTNVLFNMAPVEGADIERVSTGTKFALEEWLKLTAK